jgi:hypothetical protein
MAVCRVLTSQFDFGRRCVVCDIVLSSSLWDTKPIALQIKKTQVQPRLKYQCISCAIKGKAIDGITSYKVTVEEIIKFFHLEEKNA